VLSELTHARIGAKRVILVTIDGQGASRGEATSMYGLWGAFSFMSPGEGPEGRVAAVLDDPEYVRNLRDAQRKWRESHPGYWKSYRESHPAYVDRNRELQRARNLRRTRPSRPIAKMDASQGKSPIMPGRYQLVPLEGGAIAKTAAINVEIRVMPGC